MQRFKLITYMIMLGYWYDVVCGNNCEHALIWTDFFFFFLEGGGGGGGGGGVEVLHTSQQLWSC